MMAARTSERVKLEGFAELDRALRLLPEKMQKAPIRSSMRKVGDKLAADMRSRVARSRVHSKHIGDAIEIRGIKQKVANAVGLAIGPTRAFFYGFFIEKGTSRHAAQPWARPAFDAWAPTALRELRVILWKRIQSAARRLAKKAGRGR